MSHFNGISGGKVKRAVTEHEWWSPRRIVPRDVMMSYTDDASSVDVGGTFTYVHTRQVILQHALLFLQRFYVEF